MCDCENTSTCVPQVILLGDCYRGVRSPGHCEELSGRYIARVRAVPIFSVGSEICFQWLLTFAVLWASSYYDLQDALGLSVKQLG